MNFAVRRGVDENGKGMLVTYRIETNFKRGILTIFRTSIQYRRNEILATINTARR